MKIMDKMAKLSLETRSAMVEKLNAGIKIIDIACKYLVFRQTEQYQNVKYKKHNTLENSKSFGPKRKSILVNDQVQLYEFRKMFFRCFNIQQKFGFDSQNSNL